MFDEFMNDLIAMCDELVEEHGNDWNSMELKEKKVWIMRCIEKNAHAALENKEMELPEGKQPIIKAVQMDEEATEVEWECPECGSSYIQVEPCNNYCGYCGNRMNWKTAKEEMEGF